MGLFIHGTRMKNRKNEFLNMTKINIFAGYKNSDFKERKAR